METIRQLRSVTRRDGSIAGAKAGPLGELLCAGLSVPDGFVLTTAAYERAIGRLEQQIGERLSPEVIDDPGELEPAAAEVRERLIAEPWDADWITELNAALAPLSPSPGPASFAARTSLPSQELATAFGAGVERAWLGLCGQAAVQRGVASCWSSLWTSRSIYYRFRKKIPQTAVALAVLVQPMIRAESAGVLFTGNPMTGDPSEMQIDSIWGLGSPVTQARLRPDRFLVGRSDLVIRERRIEEKRVALSVGADGQVEQQAVPEERRAAPSLADEQVVELARQGLEIERLLGGPQDIEWAWAQGQLHILQARPIAVRQS